MKGDVMTERAVIYARSAVANDAAIIRQVQACCAFCDSHDMRVTEIIVDNGVSGVESRRSFIRFNSDVLVVSEMDRLARSTADFVRIQGELWMAGVRLVIVRPSGRPRSVGWMPGDVEG